MVRNTRLRVCNSFNSVPQWGQVHSQRLSANAPSPCHEWPHSVQEMTPFADLRPMWSKQWRNAWFFCASVI